MTVRCSCYAGLPDVSTGGHAAATTPQVCPMHGQRIGSPSPQTATGTPPSGDLGVPVVDLTATINDLRQHAAQCREAAEAAAMLVLQQRREAHYLDQLADTLIGMSGGSDDH